MKPYLELIKNNPVFVAGLLRAVLVGMFAVHTVEEGEIDTLVTSAQAILYVAIEIWERKQVVPERKLDNVEAIPNDFSPRKVPVGRPGNGPMEDTREMPKGFTEKSTLPKDGLHWETQRITLSPPEQKDYDELRKRAEDGTLPIPKEAPPAPPWLSVAVPTKAEDVKMDDTLLVLPGATIAEEK